MAVCFFFYFFSFVMWVWWIDEYSCNNPLKCRSLIWKKFPNWISHVECRLFHANKLLTRIPYCRAREVVLKLCTVAKGKMRCLLPKRCFFKSASTQHFVLASYQLSKTSHIFHLIEFYLKIHRFWCCLWYFCFCFHLSWVGSYSKESDQKSTSIAFQSFLLFSNESQQQQQQQAMNTDYYCDCGLPCLSNVVCLPALKQSTFP